MFLQKLAGRLRAARAAADVSQERAAELAGCSTASIANYEHGRAEIGANCLTALAAAYTVSADWLLTGGPMPHRFRGGSSAGLCAHEVPLTDRCTRCEATVGPMRLSHPDAIKSA